jgi:hypothetical protein
VGRGNAGLGFPRFFTAEDTEGLFFTADLSAYGGGAPQRGPFGGFEGAVFLNNRLHGYTQIIPETRNEKLFLP